MTTKEFRDKMYKVQGKTIAVVYIFEGEDAKGFEHYDIWKSEVISEWLCAIQQINCRPLIMDVRTFIQKSMNFSLPHIDYVLNLNAGNKELSTLGLVPSVCSFLDVPCIPCNTVSIIAGEHKEISNCLARTVKLNVPQNAENLSDGIFRPVNYGSSRGVIKGIIYNPLADELQVLPTIMYYSEDKDIEWFFNEEVKERRGGYKKKVLQIDECTRYQDIELAKKLGINCFCRIDARIKCASSEEWDAIFEKPVPSSKIYFIEINPMPTIKNNINIHNAIDALKEDDSFYQCYKECTSIYDDITQTGFILLCSILSSSKPGVEKERV